jgi:hypothetical protein
MRCGKRSRATFLARWRVIGRQLKCFNQRLVAVDYRIASLFNPKVF